MTYELWHTESRSMIGGYSAEADALAVVLQVVEEHGAEAVAHWMLGVEDQRGRSREIARGADLARRALAQRTKPRHVTTPV